MKKKQIRTYLAQTLLSQFPNSVAIDVLKDEEFCENTGLGISQTTSFREIDLSVSTETLFDGLRSLYEKATEVRIEAVDGAEVILTLKSSGEEPAIEATLGDNTYSIPSLNVLSPSKDLRLKELEMQTKSGFLPASVIEFWHNRLSEGVLSNEEATRFQVEMELSVQQASANISLELKKEESDVQSFVQTDLLFCEALAGSSIEPNLQGYLENVAPEHAQQLLDWDVEQGLLQLFLISAQPSLAFGVPSDDISPSVAERVFNWLEARGDRFSQVAGFEIGVRMLDKCPEIEPKLLSIAQQIKTEPPSSESGRLALTSGLFVLCDGELARSRKFSELPAYYRRLVAIGQAGILERELLSAGVNLKDIGAVASQGRDRQFYAQSLVDMRKEPRWIPDLIKPLQLQQEFLARMHASANKASDKIPEGDLKSLMLETDENGFPTFIKLPFAWLPGPLEGSLVSQNPIPDEMLEQIKNSGDQEVLDASFFAGIFHLALIYKIERDFALQIAEIVRAKNYRLSGMEDANVSSNLLFGLAIAAANARVPELSEEIRVLSRVLRRRGDLEMESDLSFRVALIASAAQPDEESWGATVGDWVLELAYEQISEKTASALRSSLRLLCHASPVLWKHVAKADAALASMEASPPTTG